MSPSSSLAARLTGGVAEEEDSGEDRGVAEEEDSESRH